METDTIAFLVFGTAFFGYWVWIIALSFKKDPYKWKSFAERKRLRGIYRERREKWIIENPKEHARAKDADRMVYMGMVVGAVIYAFCESVIMHGG